MTIKGLQNTPPREVSGSTAGDRLEYQYQRAAENCLTLLEETEAFCVFLEWHDDFVKEKVVENQSLYGFNQVKTRTASKGPWGINEVFGIPKSKTAPASKDSIAARLFEHLITFETLCDEVVLVTNCGVSSELERLIDEAKQIPDANSFKTESNQKQFSKICRHWVADQGPAFGKTEHDIFNFISKFKLSPEAARIDKSSLDYRTILSDLIFRFSEIDLTTSQAGKICSELLELVKEKSTKILKKEMLPITAEALRQIKGVQVRDLLPLLSLSEDAYLELRKSGNPVIKTLSRLQRVCRDSGFTAEQTLVVCQLKTEWDVWYLRNRSNFQDSDLLLLRGECSGILNSYVSKKSKFDILVTDAEEVANKFEPKLPIRGLNANLVMGLVFAIATERGL